MKENMKLKIGMLLVIASIFPALLVSYVGFQIEWYYGLLGIIMFILSSILYFKLAINYSKTIQS